jgi:DNA polymerase-1
MPGDYEVIGEDGKMYGLKWFWMQMLMGDTADNCPGLEQYLEDTPKGSRFKKMGEKTAEKFLAGCPDNDSAAKRVIQLYQGGYCEAHPNLWADRFVEQAALLWMRCDNTAEVDDFATHKGHSCISKVFTPEIYAACSRLKERVTLARKQINELSD